MHDEDAWTAAVTRWASRGHGSADDGPLIWLDPQDAALVTAGLIGRLRRVGLDEETAADAASEALELMARAVGRGSVDPSRSPGAFLVKVARNRAIDTARSTQRSRHRAELAWGGEPAAREPVDDLVDRLSSVQAVARAMRATDPTTRRVASAFMDLAQLYGERPAAEEVAAAAGVSRKTVFVSLRRLRDALEADLDVQGDS